MQKGRQKDRKSQKWWVTPRKPHMWAHRDCGRTTGPLQFKPDRVPPSIEMGKQTQAPSPNQEAIWNRYLLAKESAFSSESHCTCSPSFREAPHPGVDTNTRQAHWGFCRLSSHKALYGYFLSCWPFLYLSFQLCGFARCVCFSGLLLLLFVEEREKARAWSWEGRQVRGFGRSWETKKQG